MKTRIIIVDDKDNPVGFKVRDILQYQDIYRVSALWLSDKNTGDILLAQRSWNKLNDPGKWSTAVAGTVEEDETYDANILKEIQEELGLTNIELTRGPKQFVDDGKHKYFCQFYLAQVDRDKVKLIPQKEEIAAVKWLSAIELLNDLEKNPQEYPPSTKQSLKALKIIPA